MTNPVASFTVTNFILFSHLVFTISAVLSPSLSSLGSAIHASKSNRLSEARFMAYVQVLLLDLAALHSSLDELEPGFIVCHRYSDVKDEAQASKISNFVCPTETLAESLRSTLLSYARGSSATSKHLMYQKVSSVIARIQRKLDVMEEQFCASWDECYSWSPFFAPNWRPRPHASSMAPKGCSSCVLKCTVGKNIRPLPFVVFGSWDCEWWKRLSTQKHEAFDWAAPLGWESSVYEQASKVQ